MAGINIDLLLLSVAYNDGDPSQSIILFNVKFVLWTIDKLVHQFFFLEKLI